MEKTKPTIAKTEFKPMFLLGRLANGAERGKGCIIHAVPPRGPALCGADYGRMSAGWQHAEGREVTCPRCLKSIAKTRNEDLPAYSTGTHAI